MPVDDEPPSEPSPPAAEVTPPRAQPEPAVTVGAGDYVVRSGDGMGSIAKAHGHFWETLWDLPANAELKAARLHPHILLPGDRVTIPPLRMREERCATTLRHRFRRRGVPSKIRFVVRDFEGKPFAGKRYELVAGRARIEGVTDGDGVIEHWVEPLARRGEITVWLETDGYPETLRHVLRIGELDPVESLRGARARLAGLGFPSGDEDAPADEALERAVAAFQEAQGIAATGTLDDATRAALRDAHGS